MSNQAMQEPTAVQARRLPSVLRQLSRHADLDGYVRLGVVRCDLPGVLRAELLDDVLHAGGVSDRVSDRGDGHSVGRQLGLRCREDVLVPVAVGAVNWRDTSA